MRCAVLDIRTVTAAELARWEAAAEPERRARWQQFRRSDDRARSICADHLARTLLREAGAQTPVIRVGRNGKPYVPDGPAFNCSHSGNFVCCAVPGGRFDSLRFLQLWTAKEAWVKYTGEGLGVDFRTLPAAAADGLHETLFGRRLEQTITEDNVLSVVYDAV